jgi:hypothetical protein
MMYPANGRQAGIPGEEDARYDEAERMLERYGLAYVCQAPEILYGQLPMHERRVHVTPTYQPYHQRAMPLPSVPCAADDDLFARVVGAYRVLDHIFAPYEAPVPKPYDPRPAVYRPPSSGP